MWHLAPPRATWISSDWQAAVDLQKPRQGVFDWAPLGQEGQRPDDLPSLRGLTLGLNAPGLVGVDPEDCYVRRGDLVATYAASPMRDFRVQIYWRGELYSVPECETPLFGLEMIVSVQTDLLDSQPAVSVESEWPGAEFWTPGADEWELRPWASDTEDATNANPVVQRLPDCDWSLVTAVHPSDFHRCECDAGRLRFELFPQPLEKGVIRRGRVRSIWAPRATEASVARHVIGDLSAAAPPLTT